MKQISKLLLNHTYVVVVEEPTTELINPLGKYVIRILNKCFYHVYQIKIGQLLISWWNRAQAYPELPKFGTSCKPFRKWLKNNLWLQNLTRSAKIIKLT